MQDGEQAAPSQCRADAPARLEAVVTAGGPGTVPGRWGRTRRWHGTGQPEMPEAPWPAHARHPPAGTWRQEAPRCHREGWRGPGGVREPPAPVRWRGDAGHGTAPALRLRPGLAAQPQAGARVPAGPRQPSPVQPRVTPPVPPAAPMPLPAAAAVPEGRGGESPKNFIGVTVHCYAVKSKFPDRGQTGQAAAAAR